jgi:hypothetical protein
MKVDITFTVNAGIGLRQSIKHYYNQLEDPEAPDLGEAATAEEVKRWFDNTCRALSVLGPSFWDYLEEIRLAYPQEEDLVREWEDRKAEASMIKGGEESDAEGQRWLEETS